MAGPHWLDHDVSLGVRDACTMPLGSAYTTPRSADSVATYSRRFGPKARARTPSFSVNVWRNSPVPRSSSRTGSVACIYAVFFVAPSLGLPPELPGTDSAALHERQLWWIGTALCSAAGLWLLAFAEKRGLWVIGALLLIAPHALGAPQPAVHSAAAPAELADAFVRATYVANAIFWLAKRETLIAKHDGESLRFDIHLQGDRQTVFFAV